jgi:hypothetical protein
MRVCMHSRMYVSMHACMHLCMHACMQFACLIHMNEAYDLPQGSAHMYARLCACMHVYMAHTCMYTACKVPHAAGQSPWRVYRKFSPRRNERGRKKGIRRRDMLSRWMEGLYACVHTDVVYMRRLVQKLVKFMDA